MSGEQGGPDETGRDAERHGEPAPSLPPGRLEELAPRLEALLADFAHLETLESSELEPLPGLLRLHDEGDGDD